MSHCLSQHGVEHVVLERGAVAERWRRHGWDSLRLLTPNWMTRLPGFSYRGDAPDDFMAARELITLLEQYATEFTYSADHPAVLVGEDRGPTPVEFLLHGLASCITAGIGNIAAARGVTLTSVESQVEGDIDLRGILGLADSVRNGFERIRISFEIAGDAPAEKLREVVQQARARSAVFDILTNGVPVDVDLNVR